MDQNSEVLNRAINETLKKVDRNRRMRGAAVLAFGIILALFSYIPAFLRALAGASQVQYSRIIAYPCIACVAYGVVLLVFGRKARIFYLKYFGENRSGTIIFYVISLVLVFLLDQLARRLLAFLGQY